MKEAQLYDMIKRLKDNLENPIETKQTPSGRIYQRIRNTNIYIINKLAAEQLEMFAKQFQADDLEEIF